MRVFLDSNILIARIPRLIFFSLAKKALLQIDYTASIVAELRHVSLRKNLNIQDIEAMIVDLQLHGQKIEANKLPSLDKSLLKDENDIHVLAGLLGSEAQILITENLRDFPQRALFGKRAQSADMFLFDHFLEFETVISHIVEENSLSKSQLKRARLYRVAKLLYA